MPGGVMGGDGRGVVGAGGLLTPGASVVAGARSAPIHVLKFGSSVLACPEDYLRVADAVGDEAARGRRVVAVVSAMGGTTDSLLAAARSVTPAPPDTLIGALLATGEEASVALLVLALAVRGIAAVGVDAGRVPLRTRGALDDAVPVAVDAGRIEAALGEGAAVVFPGFVGVDASGARSLLGRGGSDLTALFLGHALGAAEVRLVKDVDGIFPADPRRAGGRGLEAFRDVSWAAARRVGGCVVQPKALDFAERHRVRFRVAGLGGRGTWVGEGRRRAG